MFPYSTLPLELKTSILQSTPLKVIPSLFQSNKQLRNQIRNKGPFSGRIDRLSIDFVDVDRVHFPETYLFVHLNTIRFVIWNNQVKQVMDPRYHAFNASAKAFWTLLNQATGLRTLRCKVLQIIDGRIRRGYSGLVFAPFLSEALNFPKISQLSKLSLTHVPLNLAKALFFQLNMCIVDKFDSVWSMWSDEKAEEAKFATTLCQKSTLRGCRFVKWGGARVPWPQFFQLNSRILVIPSFQSPEHFLEKIKEVIHLTEPISNDNGLVVFHNCYSNQLSQHRSPYDVLCGFFRGSDEMDALEESAEVAESFLSFINDIKEVQQQEHSIQSNPQNACFKKRISRRKEATLLITFTVRKFEQEALCPCGCKSGFGKEMVSEDTHLFIKYRSLPM